jgi:hypothetical protein
MATSAATESTASCILDSGGTTCVSGVDLVEGQGFGRAVLTPGPDRADRAELPDGTRTSVGRSPGRVPAKGQELGVSCLATPSPL